MIKFKYSKRTSWVRRWLLVSFLFKHVIWVTYHLEVFWLSIVVWIFHYITWIILLLVTRNILFSTTFSWNFRFFFFRIIFTVWRVCVFWRFFDCMRSIVYWTWLGHRGYILIRFYFFWVRQDLIFRLFLTFEFFLSGFDHLFATYLLGLLFLVLGQSEWSCLVLSFVLVGRNQCSLCIITGSWKLSNMKIFIWTDSLFFLTDYHLDVGRGLCSMKTFVTLTVIIVCRLSSSASAAD